MPRDLPLGNGDYLVTFDSRYQLRDIYYPNVGQENHTVGEPSRFGVWVDGVFAWTGDDGWDRHITYEHEALVGDTTLVHSKLGLSLRFRDAVDFDRNIYFKEVTVEDAMGRERQVRFFQHFDAHLFGNDTGDSAYYDPRSQAVVHYKGRRYFLISGSSGGSAYGLSSFAIGQKDAPGKEGTWRDARDGELSRNPVAQGSIDSVGMVAIAVPARGSATATFWIGAGQSYDEVRELDKLVRERTPASFLSRTKDYWRLWANKDESITQHLPEAICDLYKRSTLVIRTQVDNRGAIIAANDSDVLLFFSSRRRHTRFDCDWSSDVSSDLRGEPQVLKRSTVMGNFFTTLGVRPALGRAFTFDDTWERSAQPAPATLRDRGRTSITASPS